MDAPTPRRRDEERPRGARVVESRVAAMEDVSEGAPLNAAAAASWRCARPRSAPVGVSPEDAKPVGIVRILATHPARAAFARPAATAKDASERRSMIARASVAS
jgi:hypothetical protein